MTKITLLSSVLVSCAFAQPPNVLRVIRNGAIQPYLSTRSAVDVIGMSAISGFAENWLLELHDSFGSLEDLDRALPSNGIPGSTVPSDDLLASAKAMIGVYRPGLSYRPDQAFQSFPKARYLDVIVYHIKPGTEGAFANFLKVKGFSLDSINLDRPYIVYDLMSGSRAGTYVVLTPLPSLKVLDDGRARTPAYAEGERAAAGKIVAETELISEHLWFRINPSMSYVSEEFASSETAFWRPTRR